MKDHESTVAVLRHLRMGYGVEDMEVMGVANADFARSVISRLRSMGLLTGFLKS